MDQISYYGTYGCWTAFYLYWFLTARNVKPTASRQPFLSALAYMVFFYLSIVFLVVHTIPLPILNQRLIDETDAILAIGLSVCWAGLAIAIWARRTLADNWSGYVTFKRGHELIRTGPYRFVRHPIYTGMLLMTLGTAIEIGRVRGLLAVIAMTLGFWIKLRQEERLMLQHFPDQYPAYRQQVKAIVPFVV
jgi:protein-S-isoprenylcysteine O-methyltransferase Ste14